jgi:hypothetical protein
VGAVTTVLFILIEHVGDQQLLGCGANTHMIQVQQTLTHRWGSGIMESGCCICVPIVASSYKCVELFMFFVKHGNMTHRWGMQW